MAVIMNNVITHPSVRLKGAENLFDPVLCQDVNCAKKYVAHMHCPFCMRTEFFTDPVILKAHYCVKHVDKGIEFAGLKIVRCCDHCDIVGSIKGSKEIKGAHWHCFRCKNGFNRRDEALKHYRTHFRNAQTTFQIQITQDVNQSHVATSFPNDALATSTAQEIISVGEDRCLQVSVAANETVDTTTSGDLPTVMVLPSKNMTTDVIQADSSHEVNNAIYSLSSEVASSSSSDVWSGQQTQRTDRHQESPLDTAQLQIHQLQLQVKRQAAEIEALQRREADLIARLEVPLDDRVVQLLNRMKTDHEELLRRQLEELRTEYLRHIAPSPTTASNACPPQPLLILRGYDGQQIRIVQAATNPRSGFYSILPGEVTEEEEDGKDAAEDGMVAENVQNYVVSANDVSEYVNGEEEEALSGEDACDGVGVDVRDEGVVNKRKAQGSDCGVSPKRERL